MTLLSITHASALQIGDIIFSIEPSDGSGSLTRDSGHVMLVIDTGAHPCIAHAINGKVLQTLLPSERYSVIRAKNRALATQAAEIAKRWSSLAVPYDDTRVEFAGKQEGAVLYGTAASSKAPNFNKEKAVEFSKQQFYPAGAWRAVKFAARAETLPTLPEAIFSARAILKEDLAGIAPDKGLFCSMFVILCYQVAALLQSGAVMPLASHAKGYGNLSNKHAAHDQLHSLKNTLDKAGLLTKWFSKAHQARAKDLAHYLDYLQTSYPQPRQDNHLTYTPALFAWQTANVGAFAEFDFANCFTPALMLDAKTTMPTTLLFSLATDATHWDYCEEFQVAECPIEPLNADMEAVLNRTAEYKRLRSLFFNTKMHPAALNSVVTSLSRVIT